MMEEPMDKEEMIERISEMLRTRYYEDVERIYQELAGTGK